jgi:hypothetical protein
VLNMLCNFQVEGAVAVWVPPAWSRTLRYHPSERVGSFPQPIILRRELTSWPSGRRNSFRSRELLKRPRWPGRGGTTPLIYSRSQTHDARDLFRYSHRLFNKIMKPISKDALASRRAPEPSLSRHNRTGHNSAFLHFH